MPRPNRDAVPLEDARDTYRYLRAGMVVMVGMLGASVLLEANNADCFQTSISAYYYTAVHAVFIAALCAIGVQLIVYKGSSTPTEDGFLNLAGILAFIVAFVPTGPPEDKCGVLGTATKWDRGMSNNVESIMIALILSGTILWIVYRRTGEHRESTVGGWIALGVLWCVVLVGAVVFFYREDVFYAQAHNAAAIMMFLAIIVTVIISAVFARIQDPDQAAHTRMYFWLYVLIAAAMIASLAAVAIYRMRNEHWSHWVIVIEALLILQFAAYWVIQTVELWKVESRVELLPPELQAAAQHIIDEPTPGGFAQELRELRSCPREERVLRAL